MSETLARLLEGCAAAPGAIGCGVRQPGRPSHVQSFHKEFSSEALEKALLHLANANALMANHDISGKWVTWKFAHAQIFATTRSDGALFCLITRRGAEAGEFFESMASRFATAT